MKILFSNIGYAKGIDGTLRQHLLHAGRHIYVPPKIQMHVLEQLKQIIALESPDVCCFVEIAQGSWSSGRMNQMDYLRDEQYPYYDIAVKYGADSVISRLPSHYGKSNGFFAKAEPFYEHLYFINGTKRLIYRLALGDVDLYFMHFSLRAKVRQQQFDEVCALLQTRPARQAILMADFNIMRGFDELNGLLEKGRLHVLNQPKHPTFRLFNQQHVLDLCLCSRAIADKVTLKVIPQPFSDHAALLAEIT